MRKLKRWLRKFIGGLLIRRRRDEVAAAVQKFLNLPSPPRMLASGARGHDSTYLVSDGKNVLGVLRLNNPHNKRTGPEENMPFMLEAPALRIAREWDAYSKGASLGLTPKPLWRAEDALLCAYLPYQTLQKKLEQSPERAWEIITKAAERLSALHRAGLTHMDVSLPNMLGDEKLEHIVFVDFEYSPARHIDAPAQRIYDHLRLLESVWKFIPENIQKNWQGWLEIFTAAAAEDMRVADLSLLEPALGRVLSVPGLASGIRELANPDKRKVSKMSRE